MQVYLSFHGIPPNNPKDILPHESSKLSAIGSLVLMESSSREFELVAPNYIHRKQVHYDSGAQINNLSNIVYISLDTFHATVQNISKELEAWLTFLSSDSPSDIINLVSTFPEFKEYYQDIVNFRHHPKELIYMYSEALAILDYNTTQYMIDELKTELQAYQNNLQETQNDLQETQHDLQETQHDLQETQTRLAKANATIADLRRQLAEKN